MSFKHPQITTQQELTQIHTICNNKTLCQHQKKNEINAGVRFNQQSYNSL